MFLARVRALDGQFPMDDESIAQIGLVCRRLDGVPLALELAAERAISLGIGELAAGLDERFCVLTCGLRTAPPRQRTLEASLDWSYQLLTELERVVLERLSVFAEKVRLREIYAVIAYGGLTREQVAEGIIGLVSKSLLMFDSEGPAKQYYLFETTRFYGLQKLSESLHRDAITSRYAQFLETLHPVRESSYERDTDALSVVQSGIHRVHRAPNRGALLLRRFEARMSRVPS
jgi:predicted ATPase